MFISDPIWGNFQINERVLIELMNSEPVQRLKKISQAGASKYIISWKTVSRFDHSQGVMLLLRKFNASLAEQIAGLLHDVSHTVFSHVADFLFPSKDHQYHEKHFQRLILASNIPQILDKYGYTPTYIFDIGRFTLLENKIPDICADRIDYFLRDEHSQLGLNTMIKNSQQHLQVRSGEFIFNDSRAALNFARAYIKRDENSWSDPREIAVYKVLALALKRGLEEKILTEDDLFTDDDLVINKLRNSNNSYINKYLSLLNPKFTIREVSKNQADFFVRNKLRFVDPKIRLKTGEIRRVSEVFPQFLKQLEEHKQKMRQGFFVKLH